ncbi:MAG TPA: class I SAM-dependent methyltransferase [Candidatus Nitrosotenuis sp.]|nr:class I SAM-dependent methyltransferase [Candidatus Nitrosotenuis sp.]
MNAAATLSAPAAAQQESYFSGERSELLALVPRGRRKVLDCGCGYGRLGAALKARDGCRVVGLERDARAAAVARKHLDAVMEQDAEAPLNERGFDCMLYGDILEHLADPWGVLRAHAAALVPGGYVVLSVPNVRHFSVAWTLYARGRWRYARSGILDRTHLRFFALADARELVEQAGLVIEQVSANREPWSAKTVLVRLSYGLLVPDGLVVQWLMRARKPAGEETSK